MKSERDSPRDYDLHYILHAEGHRIGIMSCLQCGACVIVESDADENAKRHTAWHAAARALVAAEKGRKRG